MSDVKIIEETDDFGVRLENQELVHIITYSRDWFPSSGNRYPLEDNRIFLTLDEVKVLVRALNRAVEGLDREKQ